MKKHIAIISSSVRDGRASNRVALYFKAHFEKHEGVSAEILDLKEYNFPLFSERLAYQKTPSAKVLDFTARFTKADAIFIVTPVYNSSFSAALKNVIDLYYSEWVHKICAVASVTVSMAPGIATAQQVQSILLKLGALVVPTIGTVINVESEFNEDGSAVNAQMTEKILSPVADELLWMCSALGKK